MRDVLNIYESAQNTAYGHSFSSIMDPVLVSAIKNVQFEKAKETILAHIAPIYDDKQIIANRLKDLAAVWSLVSDKFFVRLQEITGKPFPIQQVTGYFTTAPRLSYNFTEQWFFVPFRTPILLVPTKIAHELLHFHYYAYDEKDVLAHVTKEQSENIKEALTFLLNEAFSDILVPCDKGYDKHQKLRTHLQTVWQKNKSYDELINEAIKFI